MAQKLHFSQFSSPENHFPGWQTIFAYIYYVIFGTIQIDATCDVLGNPRELTTQAATEQD